MDKLSNESKLLKAAEELFIEKGYDAAKTTEIAARAGVTHAMLHYYFRTKENLFNMVFAKKLESFKQIFSDFALAENMPLKEKVTKIVEAQFDILRSTPLLPRFVINEIISKGKSHLYKDTIASTLTEIVAPLQTQIDKEAKGTEVSAFNLAIDIVSMNVFVFLVYPLSSELGAQFCGNEEAFFDMRKKENIKVILNRLGL